MGNVAIKKKFKFSKVMVIKNRLEALVGKDFKAIFSPVRMGLGRVHRINLGKLEIVLYTLFVLYGLTKLKGLYRTAVSSFVPCSFGVYPSFLLNWRASSVFPWWSTVD